MLPQHKCSICYLHILADGSVVNFVSSYTEMIKVMVVTDPNTRFVKENKNIHLFQWLGVVMIRKLLMKIK